MIGRLKAHIKEWVPFVIVVCVVFSLGGFAVTPHHNHKVKPAPPYAPLRVLRLAVEPKILIIGESATLFNGYCNDSDKDVNVQIYFGAQAVTVDQVLQPRVVDLLRQSDGTVVKDTPELRIRQPIPPGCSNGTAIKIPVVPPLLTPGTWKLFLHLIATSDSGETQSVSETSDIFYVSN